MKLKALVVDDSSVMRKMVMAALRATNLAEFEFVEAADGQEALVKFASNEIEIIFLDWNMPNMPGIDFARKIRERSRYLPIIMVTSENTLHHVTEANNTNVDAFIAKPFDEGLVKKRVATVIDTIPKRKEMAQEAAKSQGFFSRLRGKVG